MSSINILNMRSVFSSLSARRKKEQDKGATLMEVLLVVGVIVVLAASAYKLYSMVQSNIQSSNEQNNVLTVIANMKSLKFQGRYTDSNYIKTLYAQGLLPSDMIADTTGASAKNPWGGSVTITTSSDKYSFNVVEANVPQKNCMAMVNALRSSSAISKINNTSTSTVSAATVCASDSNMLTFSTDS
ncbi:type 4 pilus major pilin [Escherichia sp. WS1342]|uniref:type 4 pilus major pilin n=1 Tax=Escherichia sp. WS1342 TaxID=3381931 RepID=UPI00396F6DE9